MNEISKMTPLEMGTWVAAIVMVPVIEIGIIIWLASQIGVWKTLALVAVSTLLGLSALIAQYHSMMRSIEDVIEEPSHEISLDIAAEAAIDIVVLFWSFILFLTPGFLTDLYGWYLMIPAVQRRMASKITRPMRWSIVKKLRTKESKRRLGA